MRELKVLLVTGTYGLSKTLKKIIEADKELILVAEANNAYDARDKILEYKPDVMLLSHDLPRMPGISFLERLMPQFPIPTVVIAPAEQREAAYEAGARDVVVFNDSGIEEYKPLYKESIPERIHQALYPGLDKHSNTILRPKADWGNLVIAMGASTGGTEALYTVIRELHKDIPGIVMVQHMPVGFTAMYAERLNNECEVDVKEAKSGDVVKAGQVLLAPGDKHMRLVKVNGVYQVECRTGPKVSGHCPSVDVLFESVAKTAGKDAIGVLMTGMGRDGAQGLLEMRKRGAITIGQDESTCVVYGMPKEAYEIGAVNYQVPVGQIAQKLYYVLGKK